MKIKKTSYSLNIPNEIAEGKKLRKREPDWNRDKEERRREEDANIFYTVIKNANE